MIKLILVKIMFGKEIIPMIFRAKKIMTNIK
jgi:hypothetical protein